MALFSRYSLLCSSLFLIGAGTAHGADDYLAYIGTYTGKGSQGIYVYRFNTASGEMTPLGLAAEIPNPSFLAVHPNGHLLYAVSEEGDTGAVSAFSIDRSTGKLALLNNAPSVGAGPCHVTVDRTGKCVLIANYGSGSVAAFPVRDDGKLGEASSFVQHKGSSVDKERQEGPHAHSVNLSPDNRFAFAADLGLDQVLVYRFDAARGTLTPNEPPYGLVKPGAGPRHFSFHPNGRFAYVINEMHNTVTAFAYDAARGALTEIQTVTTLPADFRGENSTAEVVVHPSGKFLYGSNRGHDSIAVFAVDPAKGTLTPIERTPVKGKEPRNFAVDPTGGWLIAANHRSDNLVVFRIDKKTGRLTPTGQEFKVSSPVCVRFVKAH